MRCGILFFLWAAVAAWGQDFSGVWLLDGEASHLEALPYPPAAKMTVTHLGGKVACAECAPGGWTFSTDRRSTENRGGGFRHSVAAKWEGDDLVINALGFPAAGPQFVVMDRWRLAKDGVEIRVTREYQRGGTTESKLVYRREGAAPRQTVEAPPPTLATPVRSAAPPPAAPLDATPVTSAPAHATPAPEVPKQEHVLEAGARLPLKSISTFSSKSSQEGDRVYLETVQPVSRFGRVLLPPGTQITATVTFVKGAGRVKGRGEMMLRFESLTTPEGVTKDFRSHTSAAEPNAGAVDSEGKIKAGADKAGDAGKIGKSTAVGAVIGAGAGGAAGLGVGAAAGAAVGLARVLSGRGPDVNIRKGDVVEMTLDREVRFEDKEVP